MVLLQKRRQMTPKMNGLRITISQIRWKIGENQMIYDQKYGSSYYLESDGRYAK